MHIRFRAPLLTEQLAKSNMWRQPSSACRTCFLPAKYRLAARLIFCANAARTMHPLFTIGHSNLELADFLALLLQHRVQVLCDVRSRPGSLRFPQFNRESLEAGLTSVQIQYEFLGETLGGRPSDPRVYCENGVVDYAVRRRAPDFAVGLARVIELARAQPAALMCAEEDPLHCHRFLMICPALVERGLSPLHIRRGGAIESQREAEDRLLELHGFADVTSTALFPSGRDAALEDALLEQSKQYAYRASPEAMEYF
jgi:hypothetical protein